jgi:asparagine synthase (glutamine-hydrolysing)
MVAKLARQHVKMVLTGEGGDELFAGYARYAGERLSPYIKWLPPFAGKAMRNLANKLPGMRRAKIAINALTISNEAKRFANWFPMFKDDAKQHLFADQYSYLCDGAEAIFREYLDRTDATAPLDRMLYVDCKLWLADYLLLRGDKLTMSNSLEARVPLLDHKVVEFAAALPESMKLRGSQRKYLLRHIARRLLPVDIIKRKKMGFDIPIEQWLRTDAAPLMQDLLSQDCICRRGYLNPSYIAGLISEHKSCFADHSTELWGLMSLEMWFRQFIDSKPSIATEEAHCLTTARS